MTKLILLLIFLGGLFTAEAQELPKKAIKTIESFKDATLNHSLNGVMKTLDKSYRKEQLTFLENRKEQLINELYSGTDLNEQYHNCRLADVLHIELIEWFEEGDNYTIIFNVRCHEQNFIASYLLMKKGSKFGIVGAVG